MKRASKYFYIFGGVFCLVSIISILVFAFLLFVGGFVPALVLGIIDIPYAISEGHTPYAFLEIGLPIMGGLWLGSFLYLTISGLPYLFIAMILAFVSGIKKNRGKALSIINMVLAIFLLLSGYSTPGLLILMASVFSLCQIAEEKENKE